MAQSALRNVRPLSDYSISNVLDQYARQNTSNALGGVQERFPQSSPVEQEVYKLTGMQPGLDRAALLPIAGSRDQGNLQFAAPQFMYDAAKAFVSPGVAASGREVSLDDTVNTAMALGGMNAPAGIATAAAAAPGEVVLGSFGSAVKQSGLLPFVQGAAGVRAAEGAAGKVINRVSEVSNNPNDYEVRRGRYNWEIFLNNNPVDLAALKVPSISVSVPKAKVAPHFVDLIASRSASQASRKDMRSALNDAYSQNQELIQNVHKNQNLNFTSMPVDDFNSAKITQGTGIALHKSPVRNRQQSSEYKLIMVNGEPAYARKSNHWGPFTTNIYAGDPGAPVGDMGDQFGRVGVRQHEWALTGGDQNKKNSQAGYVLLRDLNH
tara:strand:+ start:467 stop:1603 length:1137 start_codon:yes stop_codon:yes gene_type:complete